MASNDDAAARRAVGAVDRDDHVADLARGLDEVADRLGDVALRQRDPVERVGDLLLEGPALGGAPLALGLDLLELLLLEPQRLQLLLELGHLPQQRLLALVLALLGGLRATRIVPALKSASGLFPSAAENCRIRSSRERASVSPTSSRTRFCTDADEPSEKCLSSSFASWPFSGPKTLSTRSPRNSATWRALSVNSLFELGGGALELGLDELGVRAGLLAVEHARADLDRVADQLGRILAVLLALRDEPDGALVVDDEAVDDHAIAHDPDVRRPEGCCSFHTVWSHRRGAT